MDPANVDNMVSS